MNGTWTLYEIGTGKLVARFVGHASQLPGNIPQGCAAIEGEWDLQSYRFDAATGSMVDYRPEQPSAAHEWDTNTRRWTLNEEAVNRRDRRAVALARIDELERRQARRLRELLAQADPHLQAIDDEIAALRADL